LRKNKKKISDKKPNPRATKTNDSFQNTAARIGFGTPNILEGTEYPLTRLSQNYQLMNSLYRSHWIIRRIIDTIPQDMVKNWYTVTSQVAPDLIERLQKLERKTKTQMKVLEGLKWGRLYGGAAAIILIDGHQDMLDTPLDYDDIMPGSYKGLLVLDRWSGIYPEPELIDDINDPEFGLPASYRITTEGASYKVHHSRLLRFIGRDLPYFERQAEMYWGASEVEIVFDEIKKRDNTSWNIAQLVFLANLRILKMEGMEEVLAVGNERAQQDLYKTVQGQNWLASNMGVQVMGIKDTFETHQYTFTGMNDIYQSFMMDVAGAANMPVTKLFGRSPAGMNATGEGDEENYYDTVEENQLFALQPVLDKLLPIMVMSEWGQIPDDLDYKFNPIKTADNKEMSELADKSTTAIIAAYNSGLISQKTGMKELRQQSEITGLFSNITDEDIDKADDSLSQGEMIPDLGGDYGGAMEAEAEN
jgi:phage-related protein (TIGR01555 family)